MGKEISKEEGDNRIAPSTARSFCGALCEAAVSLYAIHKSVGMIYSMVNVAGLYPKATVGS